MRENAPEFLRRYEAGESFAHLAREYGVSKGAVANAVKRLGGSTRRGSYSTPGLMDRAARVRERYESGESLRDIASDLGISWSTARTDLINAGGETRAKSGFAVVPPRGPGNPAWRGGSHTNKEGYVLRWVGDDSPYAAMRPKRNPYVFEHRLVMAEAIGRTLLPTETVHHINGDRTDNRIENLQLRSGSHGPGSLFRCHDCGSDNVGPVPL